MTEPTDGTTTIVEMTSAQIAEQLGVKPQTFNTWKRLASLQTGTSYGTKRGKGYVFSAEEVSEILHYGQSNEERSAKAPKQTYESEVNLDEDFEGSEDSSFMVLAQQNGQLVTQVQTFLSNIQQQDQMIAETIAAYAAPQNRMARILGGVANRLTQSKTSSLQDSLMLAMGQFHPTALLPEADKKRILECL
jgi:uncharacterized protein YjcR